MRNVPVQTPPVACNTLCGNGLVENGEDPACKSAVEVMLRRFAIVVHVLKTEPGLFASGQSNCCGNVRLVQEKIRPAQQ